MREDSGFLPYSDSDSGPRAAGGHSAAPGGHSARSAGGYRPSGPSHRRALMTHLAVAVLAAGAATGVTLGLDRPVSPASASTAAALPGSSAVPAPAASPAAGGGTGNAEQQVVNKVEPGLVVINTTMQYNGEAGAGTGMVINPSGLVLTNNHVIEDSTKITATVAATGKSYPAAVIGYDKTADIALIQLQGAAGLRTVPVGNSAAVKDGEQVVALGNAEGQGTAIPAAGQVTGTGKSITAADQGGTAATETLHGMIQISAGIVPGDSGGPLSTDAGQVIGMDTAGDSVSLTQPADRHRVRDPDRHRAVGRPADRRRARQLRRDDRLPAVHRDLHRRRQPVQPAGPGPGTAGAERVRGRVRRLRRFQRLRRPRDRPRLLHQQH